MPISTTKCCAFYLSPFVVGFLGSVMFVAINGGWADYDDAVGS
jgi:hypothetical protein